MKVVFISVPVDFLRSVCNKQNYIYKKTSSFKQFFSMQIKILTEKMNNKKKQCGKHVVTSEQSPWKESWYILSKSDTYFIRLLKVV